MSRDTTLEIRELIRGDETLQGIGVRKVYLLLKSRGLEYTQKQVQNALSTIREHIVRQHQPSRAWSFVAPQKRYIESDLGEFRHGREMRYLFAAIDVGSKRLFAASLPDKTAETVSDAISAMLRETGPVRVFRSDIGSEFTNSVVARLLRRARVQQAATRGTAHFVERVIGTIRKNVSERLALEPLQTLDDVLDKAVTQYNNTIHTAHGFSPLEADKDENWPIAHARLLKHARLPGVPAENREFSVGDQVFSLKEGALRGKRRFQHWSRSSKTVVYVDKSPLTNSGIRLSDGASAYRPDMLRTAENVSSLRQQSPPRRERAPATAPAAASSRAASARTRGRPRADYATMASTILFQ
jgi:hypothetical protein